MIGVVVYDDVVIVPEPVTAVAPVIRSNGKPPTLHTEALATTIVHAPDVPRAKPAGKMAVFPRPVEAVVHVTTPGVVAHPLVVARMHVRRLRMVLAVAIPTTLIIARRFIAWFAAWFVARPARLDTRLGGGRAWRASGRRTVRRNVASTELAHVVARSFLTLAARVGIRSNRHEEYYESRN